jgi:hypothetical protein
MVAKSYTVLCKTFSKTVSLIKDDFMVKVKKVKTIPLQVWTGPEGSSNLRLPDFKTVGT